MRHWRQEHGTVRDLVFMHQSSGQFTQVSDLFSHVILCSQSTCGHVVYTNDLDTARARLQRHAAGLHKTDEGGTEMLTTDFLSLNLPTSSEEIDAKTSSSPRKTVSVEDNDISVESLEVTGYKCGVDTCSKIVHVSRTCGSTVALSKLKSHFNKMHKELDSSVFGYNILHNRDTESAVNVSLELQSRSPVDEDEVYVFQCPVTTKGGRQCAELAMDVRSLMIHWGSSHHTEGEEFLPRRLSIDRVSHFQCQVTGCAHKHLSLKQLREHWEEKHTDCPDKFAPVHNKMKILTPRSTNTPALSNKAETKKSESKKRFRLSSSAFPSSSKRQKLDKNSAAPKLNCDVQANFDLSGVMENGSSMSSDSDDFEMGLDYRII